MTNSRTLVPSVSPPPPPGYRLVPMLSPDALAGLLADPAADGLDVTLTTRRAGQVLSRASLPIRRDPGGGWMVAGGTPTLQDLVSRADWIDGASVPYVEVDAATASPAGFSSIYGPGFYTVFTSPEAKTFLSDNAVKYANYVVTSQVQAFGAWCEGYPLVEIDRGRDAGASVLLVNPHERAVLLTLDLPGRIEGRRLRLDAGSARRVDLAALLGEGVESWSGQVFVSGINRVNMFFLTHSLADPCRIASAEHSEVFRGEDVRQSWLRPALAAVYRLKRRLVG